MFYNLIKGHAIIGLQKIALKGLYKYLHLKKRYLFVVDPYSYKRTRPKSDEDNEHTQQKG